MPQNLSCKARPKRKLHSLVWLFFGFSFFTFGKANPSLTQADSVLSVVDSSIRVSKSDGTLLLQVENILFDYQPAQSLSVAESTENTLTLDLEFPGSVDYYRSPTDDSARLAKLTISVVEGGYRFHCKPEWANQVTLKLRDLGGSTFGLSSPLQPDNQLSPNLKDARVEVLVENEGENITENYASAFSSLFLNSRGYGAFFDSFAHGIYTFSKEGFHEIHHRTGELDWYVFIGEDGRSIHQSYFSLIGAPKALPLWGLGPIGWRDQNDGGAAEILDDIRQFNELQIPLTSWFVDRPYSDGNHAWSEMNFSTDFSEPEKWIQAIREEHGLEFMTWTSTAMFGSKRFPKHFDGSFTYLDLSHPATVAQYQDELREKQYSVGVKGHKMDRADEGFPGFEKWHVETILAAERKNRYAYLFSKVHHEALQEAWGADQLNFARAAIHRAQPYLSAVWGGDPRQNWDGLQNNMANGIRASFMGFPVWGTDVGGYIGDGFIDEALYIRWLQAGSVTGLFEIKLDGSGGDGPDRMPWRYGERLQSIFRSICEDRMRLLPYLYSLSHTAEKTGTLMQPMAYQHLSDPNTHELWDQFYFGPNLLVAPVLGPQLQRDVYFPAGIWYNFDNPSEQLVFYNPQWQSIDAPLEKLPRWVRANSILVTGNIYSGNQSRWNKAAPKLEILVFADGADSETSFDFVDPGDGDSRKTIRFQRNGNNLELVSPALSYPVSLTIHLPKGETLNSDFPAGTEIHFTRKL